MKIFCKKCNLFLGDIEGKIRKKISFLCKKCEIQREALELRYSKKDNDFSTGGYDFMDKIFNDGFKL